MDASRKSDLMSALQKYLFPGIGGLLIEVVPAAPLEPSLDYYHEFEVLMTALFDSDLIAPPLDAFDWEVGESRWRRAFLLHVWSDAVDLDAPEDFERAFAAEDLARILALMETMQRHVEEMGDGKLRVN